MKLKSALLLIFSLLDLTATAVGLLADSLQYRVEMQASLSGGEHEPLWLNANKYGLSSLDKSNGYVRAMLMSPADADASRKWRLGYGVDMALAAGFTSTLVVQQAYAECRWKNMRLTLGAREFPMEMKNAQLSSGSQTLGVNARPVPQLRLEAVDFWQVPGVKWLGLKGHIAYGLFTDDGWQESFAVNPSKVTRHALFHSKAGFLRLGRPGRPLTMELGLEMASQFGGKSFLLRSGDTYRWYKNDSGLKGFWHALVPGGAESVEHDYANASGNQVGSWLARVSLDYDSWGASLYADHFFEDDSGLFLLDYDGYGKGDDWNRRVDARFLMYDLKDGLLGLEIRLKRSPWLNRVVLEYLGTKYQSGPIYHDHTMRISDHVGGKDNYYQHYVFTGWQHWGQAIGNPLYRSPLYNENHVIDFENTRFRAWHLGLSGRPVEGLVYRLLATWQRGYGTYKAPFLFPQENVSLLAEAAYAFPQRSRLTGWSVKLGLGMDRGELLGDNAGVQLTVAKSGFWKQIIREGRAR